MKGRASSDPEADAVGVYFAPEGAVYLESEEVAPGLTLDFDADGRVIGLDIPGVKRLLADRALQAPERAEAKPAAA